MLAPTEPRLLRIPEVAARLDVTAQRAYELARSRSLPTVRIGRQLRVDPDVLQAWIDSGGQLPPLLPLCGGCRSVREKSSLVRASAWRESWSQFIQQSPLPCTRGQCCTRISSDTTARSQLVTSVLGGVVRLVLLAELLMRL